jgi:hypothetical protein
LRDWYVDRFFSRTVRAPNGCLEWTGGVSSHGYGSAKLKECGGGSHRVAWFIAHGGIPAGFSVCHRCDNRKCVDVAHMFLGSQADNMRDMVSKGRGVLQTERPVEALDPSSGAVIHRFPSTSAVKSMGWHQGNVSSCAQGKRKTAHGFSWRYAT